MKPRKSTLLPGVCIPEELWHLPEDEAIKVLRERWAEDEAAEQARIVFRQKAATPTTNHNSMNDIASANASAFNPHGSREQIFREHEHIFTSYMRTYPKSLEVQCGAIVPESLASRLRKVAHELMHYRWETSFSITDFETAWRNTAIRVSMARTVVIGPKKGKIEIATSAKQRGQPGQVAKHTDDPRVLESLMYLHSTGAFEEATHMPTLSDAEGNAMNERLKVAPMNVALMKQPGRMGWFLF